MLAITKNLLKWMKKGKKGIVFLFFIILLYSITSIFPVYLIEKIVDSINFIDSDEAAKNILFFGFCYLILQVTAQLLEGLTNFISQKLQIEFGENLQLELFDKIAKMNVLKKENTVLLTNKIIEDAKYISDHSISSITIFFQSIFTFLVGFYFMVKINVSLTLIILPLGIVVSTIAKEIEKRYEAHLVSERNMDEQVWLIFSEGIKGIKTLQIFDPYKNYFRKLSERIQSYKKVSIDKSKINHFGSAIVNVLYMVSIGCILTISAIFVTKGWISFGGLTALIMYNHMLIDPLIAFFACRKELINVKVSFQRIQTVLQTETSEQRYFLGQIDKIILESVSFEYKDEKKILENISYCFESGKRYVIYGESGSGKTSLIHLIAKFYEPTSGNIFYISEGEKIFDTPNISFLMQDGFLFDDTVKENILLANPSLSNSKLEEIEKDCMLEEIVERIGEDKIGENGNKLSGGERKRVLLAQCLAKRNANILLFDELSSSLDESTFEWIMHNLDKYLENKICIFIEHNTTYDFDGFVKLNIVNGKLTKKE